MPVWKSMGYTHELNKRSNRENSFLVDIDAGLTAIANGMRRHTHGKPTSQEVVEVLSRLCIDHHAAYGPGRKIPITQKQVLEALTKADQQMCRYMDSRATTLTCCWFPDAETGMITHLGNSIVLRLSRVSDRQDPTKPDTVATIEDLVVEKLTPTQSFRKIACQFIGDQNYDQQDILVGEFNVLPDDVWIIASDGLLPGKSHAANEETNKYLLEIVGAHAVRTKLLDQPVGNDQAKALANQAQKLGSTDNTTVIMVQF